MRQFELPVQLFAGHYTSSSGLPWTVQAAGAGPPDSGWRGRTSIMAATLTCLFLLIAAAGWILDRTLRRQIALAHDQAHFVSAVSHEFRTPLTTLRQLTELLLQGRVASEEDRLEYYRLLHFESDRLQRLVEGFLNFGRLEAGRPVLHFEALDVAEAAGACVREMQARHAEFAFEVEIQHGILARADRDAFGVAMSNLLDNAVKYSLDRRRVWVRAVHGGGMVSVSVRDEGLGIPRSEQKRVFEKFLRGEEARRRGIRGAGVGLATVSHLAAFHGGSIELESEPGRGSTFTLRIPAWGA
jgi:signal transduction histidine kinase